MVRGKEIDDPVRQGHPSKIYLAAFTEPMTGYKLAKKVFGVETYYVPKNTGRKEKTEVKQPNKPYEIAKNYGELFDRPEEDGKNLIFSKVEPFLERLEKNLKESNNGLTKSERKRLKSYLEGPFRKATQKKYLDIDFGKEVDAYSELLGLLTSITSIERAVRTSISFLKKSHKAHLQGRMREEFYDVWQNKAPQELNFGSVPWGDKEIFEPVKDFSDELFEKLEEADLGGSKEILKKHGEFIEKVINKTLSEIRN